MEKDISWPPIRQADAYPVRGGWSVIYTAEDLTREFNARGSTPRGVLQLIVTHRLANDLPPAYESVRYFLEAEWHKRDPRRFTRSPIAPPMVKKSTADQPSEPACDVDGLFSATVNMLNAAAASGQKHTVGTVLQSFQALLKDGRFRCEKCDSFLAEFMKLNPMAKLSTPSLVRDWAWEFQSQFARHLQRPVKPREAVEAQWCWPPS